MIAHCALSGLLVWRFTCFRIFEWRFLHPQQAREAPETGLVLHMVGNFWIDLFLSKNAFSLKLSCAGDIDSDFFIFFFALAFCCRLYYYQLVRNEVQNKKKKRWKLEWNVLIHWFLVLFYGKFQFFSPLWNETIFATSAVHARDVLKFDQHCADLHCSSPSFQLAVLCNFCCGQWCDLVGIIREVVWVSAWRKECGSSEQLLLRTGRKDAWLMEGKWRSLAGCSPGLESLRGEFQ